MIDLSLVDRVEGPNLVLRLIQPDDADYVQNLRTDPAYNQHLSQVSGSVESQRRWIEQYKTREAEGRELYYVIERKDAQRCGLVRLYDIGEKTFTWGSWILDVNKPPKAALESAILSFGVGFNALDLHEAYIDVRIGNKKAIDFYIKIGMEEIKRDKINVYFVYFFNKFNVDRNILLNIINKSTSV